MQYDFEDPRFEAQLNYLPWAQIINPSYGDEGIKPYGLGIKLSNGQAASFCPDDSYELVNHSFSNKMEEMLITNVPRLSIVSKGLLYIKNRETGITVGTLKDNYELFLKEKLKYKVYNKCLIFLFNAEGKLLHDLPLQLTLSGASGASFNKAYSGYEHGLLSGGFTYELQNAYSKYRNQRPAPKGQLFYAHGIYAPKLGFEERHIDENTFSITVVEDYEHPTAGSLSKYLIDVGTEESNIITGAFEKYKDFGKVVTATAVSTPTVEDHGDDDSWE